MRVLGIETSCDETGVAIYDTNQGIMADVLHSQVEVHAHYGGVVPELASRDHTQKIIPLIERALTQSGNTQHTIDGIAYTVGPGLVGALLVGAMVGRTLAYAWNIPAVGIHHMEGHMMACMLETPQITFPFIALLVSGGHTQLIHARSFQQYEIIGDTLDDAAGEAFDKTAKVLGLGYPGGAALAALATKGSPGRFRFPRPMIDRPGLDFSYSGLKTFAVNTAAVEKDDDQTRADIAWAFQDAVIDTLVIKCQRALQVTGCKHLIVAGGVGANLLLRQRLQAMVLAANANVFFPRAEFCTDNGAMIAYAGCQHLLRGAWAPLPVNVYPRWSLADSLPKT